MWQTLTLDQACELVTDGSHNSPKDSVGGMPMASVKDMTREGITIESCRTISKEDFLLLVKNGCQPKYGDVLIAKDGATCLDTVCVYRQKDEIVILSSIAILRPGPNLDSGYLRYYLEAPDTMAMLKSGYISGSAIPRVVLRDFRRAPITIPSLPEQRAIAGILGALDDKIELNRRMNATIKSIIWLIFKSWFVDFDPIHAKVSGEYLFGMDEDTANLFPSSFEGDVPKGWKFVQFSDFLTHKTDRIGIERAQEYSATVNGLSLRDNNFIKVLSKSNNKNKKVVKNNLVFGLSRETLNFGVMKEDIGSVSPVYEIFDIDTNIYIPELLEMYIRMKMDEFIGILKPAAREGQAIDRKYLLSKRILVPDMQIQKKYQDFCSAFQNQIENNKKESRTLANLRDSLLPRLMRGEVRLSSREI